MTTIKDAQAATARSAAPLKTTTSGEMQDRFLKLLVAQMKNQDPLSPMENAEVTSQMAQMSTVSGIEKLNDLMSGLSSSIVSTQVGQAASLLGKTVYAESNKVKIAAGQGSVDVSIPEGAKDLKLDILDSTGKVIKTIEDSNVKNKTYQITGLPNGNYEVSLKAFNENGLVENAKTITRATVTSLTPTSSGFSMNLDSGAAVPMSAVKNIS